MTSEISCETPMDPVTRLVITRLDMASDGTLQQWFFDSNDVILIGRSLDCDMRVDDRQISRLHAVVFFDGELWHCSSLGRNGIYVDQQKVEHTEFAAETVVRMSASGPQLLFDLPGEDEQDASIRQAGEVKLWLDRVQDGDNDAINSLWNSYFPRIVALARRRLENAPRRAADEEDVALSVLRSFFRRAAQHEFPQLTDRDDLWRLLAVMTARKAVNLLHHERAQKRGGGAVRGDSILRQVGRDDPGGGFDRFPGQPNRPDMVALLAEEAQRQMSLLDADHRAVATLRIQGYTNAEIAEQLGTTTRTVERRLQRVRDIWSDDDGRAADV